MGRLSDTPILASKTLIELLLVVVLVTAGLFIVRQLQHNAIASSDNGIVHSIKVSNTNTSATTSTPPQNAANDDSTTSSNTLVVNGQAIALPANGSYSQTTTDGNTTTTIDSQTSSTSMDSSADTSGQTSASNSNTSTVNISVNSNSSQGGSL